MSNKTKFGLVGKDISYSFSAKYFTEKFNELGLTNYSYKNYDLPEIFEFPFITYHKEDEYGGFNVTIPYKESVMRYLQEIDEDAEKIGAVNTIKVTTDNKLIGYNTDFYGFKKSIQPLIESHHKKALILGTGGASKAIVYALSQLGIQHKFVSRKLQDNVLLYSVLTEELLKEYTVIINCSPVGTFPNINESPKIPYEYIT